MTKKKDWRDHFDDVQIIRFTERYNMGIIKDIVPVIHLIDINNVTVGE